MEEWVEACHEPGERRAFEEDWRAERPPGAFLDPQRSLKVEAALPTSEAVEGKGGSFGQARSFLCGRVFN